MKYVSRLAESFSTQPAFGAGEVKRLFPEISTGYLDVLLHNLEKKKKIHRISRGIYTFRDDPQVVGFAFRPFYYGLQDAMSLLEIWEQETNPVVITPRKVRTGLRQFEGSNYLVRRVNRKMFFGFEQVKYGDIWIPVSDIEKTFIDLVYFDNNIPEDALKAFKRRIDKEKLTAYLKKCDGWVRKRVGNILFAKKRRDWGQMSVPPDDEGAAGNQHGRG